MPRHLPSGGILEMHQQTDRLLENIDELLREGGSCLDKVPYFVIYLRDISDYSVIDVYMQERFPAIPRILLEARVCRPSWLIEMECEVGCGAAILFGKK